MLFRSREVRYACTCMYMRMDFHKHGTESHSGLTVNRDILPELEGENICHCVHLTSLSDKGVDLRPQGLKVR